MVDLYSFIRESGYNCSQQLTPEDLEKLDEQMISFFEENEYFNASQLGVPEAFLCFSYNLIKTLITAGTSMKELS